MGMKSRRKAEVLKYERAYSGQPNYRMKPARMQDALNDLRNCNARGSYLDVSCGRGEMLVAAATLGFRRIQGTEATASLCNDKILHALGHDLPFADGEFEVVSMFDVIEHLIPGDDELVVKELLRVSSKYVLVTANNRRSRNKFGDELHINRRPYEEWDKLFRSWAPGCHVEWLRSTERHYVSEAWRITKG